MKSDGMKIGLLVVLVGAGTVLYYNQFVHAPDRVYPVPTAEEEAEFKRQTRIREILAKQSGYEIAGS